MMLSNELICFENAFHIQNTSAQNSETLNLLFFIEAVKILIPIPKRVRVNIKRKGKFYLPDAK